MLLALTVLGTLAALWRARRPRARTGTWRLVGRGLLLVLAVGWVAASAYAADADPSAPAVGLLLYASYPAGDVRSSLSTAVESVSGRQDGLATPAKIASSRADLPADATFTVIDGASHAPSGAYGAQPGDGIPTISDEQVRTLITQASPRFVDSLDR